MRKNANKNYATIRAGLLHRGFTIRSWAMLHGHPVTTVYGAARGERAGVKATQIVKQLHAAITE